MISLYRRLLQSFSWWLVYNFESIWFSSGLYFNSNNINIEQGRTIIYFKYRNIYIELYSFNYPMNKL